MEYLVKLHTFFKILGIKLITIIIPSTRLATLRFGRYISRKLSIESFKILLYGRQNLKNKLSMNNNMKLETD